MKILVIDVGGTHVKVRDTGHKNRVEILSGLKMTANKMVAAVQKITAGWKYDVITIGYPGPVLHGHIVSEPHNLGRGWVKFNFKKAFGRLVKIINDAAMRSCSKNFRPAANWETMPTHFAAAFVFGKKFTFTILKNEFI